MKKIMATLYWTKENSWEFVTYYFLRKTKKQNIMIPIYFICMAIIVIAGITAFIITKISSVLLMAFLAVLVLGVYGFVFNILMRGMAKKLLAANEENNGMGISFDENEIMLYKNNVPFGIISWDNIESYSNAENSTYITIKSNAILLIEHSRISEGTSNELAELLEGKNIKRD